MSLENLITTATQSAQSTLEFVGNQINNVGYGLKGAAIESPVAWISSAATYYVTWLAIDNQWLKDISPKEASQFVLIAVFVYGFFNGIATQGKDSPEGKATDLRAHPRLDVIVLTNAIAAAAGISHVLKMEIPLIKAIMVTAIAVFSVSMGLKTYYAPSNKPSN